MTVDGLAESLLTRLGTIKTVAVRRQCLLGGAVPAACRPPCTPLLYEAKWVLCGRGRSGGSGASLPDRLPILDVIDHACPNASTPASLPRRTQPFSPPRVTSNQILEKALACLGAQ